MYKKYPWIFLFLAAAVLKSALAHHAFSAEFDADAPISVRGHVKKIEWINPHAWLDLALIEIHWRLAPKDGLDPRES